MSSVDSDDTAGLVESLVGNIDGLDQESFDSLPFGAIQVDGLGIIHRYNMTESRLSGRTPERVLGKNFFLDVAPCTNIPAFAGRFREGVERGSLDVGFEFVFDFHMAPIQVEILMRNAGEPDRYWLLVRKIADLKPNRPESAQAIVAARVGVPISGQVADFSICEKEQIHLSGAVQPFGALVVVRAEGLRVVAASANVAALFGSRPPLGRGVETLIGPGNAEALAAWAADPYRPQFWRGEVRRTLRLDLCAHRSGPDIIVEAEPQPARDPTAADALLDLLEREMATLRRTERLSELAQAAARAIRRVTRFERVLVYRFDSDWHGEVVAEDKVPDWDQSFAGLHFPASDIPRQARELYTRSLSRHVPDRDYVPVPIEALPECGQVDLSLARHRSLSPVHLEYHRNMGVNGSMSYSVLVDGRLWGLVACHHRLPHYVDVAHRSAAMTIVEALAMRIAGVERHEANRGRRGDLEMLNRLMVRMASADDLLAALAEGSPSLMDLFGASGAAMCVDDHLVAVGNVPADAFIRSLAEWLEQRWDSQGLFQTDSLSLSYPDAHEVRDRVSGLLALRLGEGGYVLWFRPEQPKILTWGGNPAKPVSPGENRPLPRASFERWAEERRGYAEPWAAWAAEIAVSLRHAISDVMLRHLRQVRQLSEQLSASNQAKAQFLANMSHELRTPLNAVIGFSELMLAGIGGPLTDRHRDYLKDITTSGQHLLALVNDVLDLSRIDAGRMELHLETLSAMAVIEECRVMVQPRAADKRIALTTTADPGLRVRADRVRLRQILLNLMANAVKFTPAGGSVSVVAVRVDGAVRFSVSDTGPGMSAMEAELALEPFRQVESEVRAAEEGTGLGLPIAKSLAELHGGLLVIDSAPGRGTTVHITVPESRRPE